MRQVLGTAVLVGAALVAARLPGGAGQAAARAVSWTLGQDTDLGALSRQATELGRELGLQPPPGADGATPVLSSGALPTELGPLTLPVTGPVSAWFGWREVAGRPQFHPGLDFRVPSGTAARAVADGQVARLDEGVATYGHTVLLEHRAGWQSFYGDCASLTVRVGEAVKAGQTVCLAGGGAEGPAASLHFELRQGGQAVDPAPYLGMRAPSGR